MCGIAGVIGDSVDSGIVERMMTALAHRGPDANGIWHDPSGKVVLGHTRLAIIDLSDAGRQPMHSLDGRYWITFNGEIYNYEDLRRLLEYEGYRFKTHSDTEVVLAAFSRWSIDCLNRLRGMFAFCLWDRQEQCAYIVRDRLGIKPVFWTEIGRNIIFASEIKAILASEVVKPVINLQSVYDLLATGSIEQPRTALSGVHALNPATCFILKANGSRESVQYWDLHSAVIEKQAELARLSYEECVSLTRQMLEEATRYHLVADVKIGSFLSGGIDSTSVTALMSQMLHDPVRSFSIGFEANNVLQDELAPARLAAQKFGCEHSEVVLTGQDIALSFDEMIQAIDQPSRDGANTFFVSRAASKYVKVALSGLGGDELFAGYPHFAYLRRAGNRQPNWLDRVQLPFHHFRPSRFTLIAAVRCTQLATRYANLRRMLSDSGIQRALNEPLLSGFNPGFREEDFKRSIDDSLDSVTQTSLIECNHYLRSTLLRDADAMSMWHALEVRPILLDHPLVEHALALPSSMKMKNKRQKAILVDAVSDLLPAELLSRAKTGFDLPMGIWLQHDLYPIVTACLASPWARAAFRPSFLTDCAHRLQRQTDHAVLLTVTILTSWGQHYNVDIPE